ncbi:Scr1 family TA system antitoxin-like transcriptional regulator, partial [Nocardia wallacei]|uniref:Scr1 family TA system antitoxin-like transcriptional regulator n=1 Tax=Nocardia wallacei TaxID=480035 RepID=UPI003CC7F4F3
MNPAPPAGSPRPTGGSGAGPPPPPGGPPPPPPPPGGQTRITRKHEPASLSVILRESAIRGIVGGARVMAAQLKHLVDMGSR